MKISRATAESFRQFASEKQAETRADYTNPVRRASADLLKASSERVERAVSDFEATNPSSSDVLLLDVSKSHLAKAEMQLATSQIYQKASFLLGGAVAGAGVLSLAVGIVKGSARLSGLGAAAAIIGSGATSAGLFLSAKKIEDADQHNALAGEILNWTTAMSRTDQQKAHGPTL